ncbi:dihydropteroate synthase [Hymenobacter humi]
MPAQPLLHASPQSLLSPHGRLLNLHRPQVMGILNLTPDSFFAGSRVASERDLLGRAEAMLAAGAAVLDLGAYSTRPGADDISADEEARRLLPAVELLRHEFPQAFLSADTFRAGVAEAAVAAGADMVNDVSGGTLDAAMFATVGRLRVPYVLMHMRGTPQTMAQLTHYEDDLVLTLLRYFRDGLHALRQAGRGRRAARPRLRLCQDGRSKPRIAAPPARVAGAGAAGAGGPLAQKNGVRPAGALSGSCPQRHHRPAHGRFAGRRPPAARPRRARSPPNHTIICQYLFNSGIKAVI